MKSLHTRSIALLAGGALATSMLLTPAPARADKSKSLKIGALVLGAAAVISAANGKDLPAAAAAAGAYYAYKKSKDAKNDEYSDNGYPGDIYADNGNGRYGNGGYGSYPADNGGYNSYPGDNGRGGRHGAYSNDNDGYYNNYPGNDAPYYGNTDNRGNDANCDDGSYRDSGRRNGRRAGNRDYGNQDYSRGSYRSLQ